MVGEGPRKRSWACARCIPWPCVRSPRRGGGELGGGIGRFRYGAASGFLFLESLLAFWWMAGQGSEAQVWRISIDPWRRGTIRCLLAKYSKSHDEVDTTVALDIRAQRDHALENLPCPVMPCLVFPSLPGSVSDYL